MHAVPNSILTQILLSHYMKYVSISLSRTHGPYHHVVSVVQSFPHTPSCEEEIIFSRVDGHVSTLLLYTASNECELPASVFSQALPTRVGGSIIYRNNISNKKWTEVAYLRQCPCHCE